MSNLRRLECRSQDPSVTWWLLARPHGSNSDVESLQSNNTTVFLDVVGTYRLVPIHDEGLCEELEVTVHATEAAAVQVILEWETLEAEGELARADLDIHLRHPEGCWFDEPWDCHYRNSYPDWGMAGWADDDPTLGFDANTGGSPETLWFTPEPRPRKYELAIHYRDGFGEVPANANLRVYLGAELVVDETRALRPGEFWTLGQVRWPEGWFDRQSRIRSAAPEGCE